jgi:hypothetical protein
MPPEIKYPSPSGAYQFLIVAHEMRMSLWIEWPTLVNANSGQILLRFSDSLWSLDVAEWLSDSLVRMTLRHYPGKHVPPQFEVVADCVSLTATIQGGAEIPFAEVESALARFCQ